MKLIPEWYDHAQCLIAWPCNLELYGPHIQSARKEISNLANQIAEEEPVYIYCNPQDMKDCSSTVSNQKISIIEANLDDSWMRDIAPIFYREGKDLNSINFNFNGYGKYPNFKNDNLISDIICNQFKIPFKKSSITLEGGGITYDDQGNLFTTESVLLNPNRNNFSKQFLEEELKKFFSLKNIIWLKSGLFDDDTDGHIDNIFCPIGNNQFLIASTKDTKSKNYNILQEAKELVKENLSRINPKNEIIEIPLPSKTQIDNKVLVASYINFYFCKNSLIIPKFNTDEDLQVYDIFQSIFPNKKIKMIETTYINYGGGNIHCVTMNVPKI
ncbi:agmatine deiminase family protein [Alphaproteobacteria bacterium]|jgi:agmatine deiminase|nr:agmatine deiminase family protein [Alphaproteobacteria bacterium]MDB2371397.1 agmatine deiminase family protein [Alphaproteobacteria bacterium]